MIGTGFYPKPKEQMGDSTEENSSVPGFSYRGSVSGLKDLLTNKIAEGFASVVSTIDRFSDEQAGVEGTSRRIPIEEIYPSPDQPRQIFEPKSLEELSVTMKELGQAQAITVRKTPKGFEIISGERRYRAAKLAGLTHLDCLVKDCSLEEARILALVENVQRQDLLPIEEAHYIRRVLHENPGLSLEKLARMLGSHKSTLSEKVQLTEVPEDLQALLYSKGRNFTHRHWRVLSRIQDPVYLRQMFVNAVEHQVSVADLERSLDVAGVKKIRRKRGPIPLSESQLSFDDFGFIYKEDRLVRVRAVTFEVEKIPVVARQKLIADLEDLLKMLRHMPDESGELLVETQPELSLF